MIGREGPACPTAAARCWFRERTRCAASRPQRRRDAWRTSFLSSRSINFCRGPSLTVFGLRRPEALADGRAECGHRGPSSWTSHRSMDLPRLFLACRERHQLEGEQRDVNGSAVGLADLHDARNRPPAPQPATRPGRRRDRVVWPRGPMLSALPSSWCAQNTIPPVSAWMRSPHSRSRPRPSSSSRLTAEGGGDGIDHDSAHRQAGGRCG